ncbi:hypothetical protein R1flu_022023 [Riccia fluitans]|uniref:RNA helicase n=1 Tax=Riccia fluitans TaxID=41844 RepID=A0ABD1ZR03_9MARC
MSGGVQGRSVSASPPISQLGIETRRGGELPFKVGWTGYSGHLWVEPTSSCCEKSSLSELPDLILPPAFPPETPDSIRRRIENEYLSPSLDDELDSASNCGKSWDFDWYGEGIRRLDPSQPQVAVVPVYEPPFRRANRKETKRNVLLDRTQLRETTQEESPKDPWIPGYEQVEVIQSAEGAHNSSSVLRKPGPPDHFVKGSSGNQPFLPGGFDLSQTSERYVPEGALNGEWVAEILQGGPLQTVPPGFKRGLDLGTPEPFSHGFREEARAVDVSSIQDAGSVPFNDLFRKAWEESEVPEETYEASSFSISVAHEDEQEEKSAEPPGGQEQDQVLENIFSDIKEEILSSLQPEEKRDAKKGEVWAVMETIPGIAEKFSELVPDMAMTFPFELDAFQKEAVYHLERNESVFVAAHTSAGKTVVAEYAFALATKHCTRAVYTSPIKTISNQKFRDFSDKFDVGILTGDVSLRPEASCLIMTTEILRSMLYKGADIVRDIEWVIFDEVHYVNDVERGVVWEEVIIMLPEHVNMVLLSATVPNTFEFADWIGRTKKKKIFVTGTMRRPVPLEHCLYYSGELYKICSMETFLPLGVKEARDAHHVKTVPKVSGGGGGAAQGRGAGYGAHGRGGGAGRSGHGGKSFGGKVGNQSGSGRGGNGAWRSETSQWYSFVNYLLKKALLPVVVFCFSKARCDQSADSLTAIDLTTGSEKSQIKIFCDTAFSRLKGSDRRLPQVVRVEDLLRRGIGVHHAGLLPIVKEVVEMLFCRGVIKVLFSTETFAMGVNAPARTVAFHSFRKHDGKSFRQLLPGEYTQMAGRAGRRGLDKVGTVVVMCWDDIPEEGDLRRLLTGKPTKLESQFRLTYSMILNLLRVEELKVEDMLKRSFAEFHAQRALPEQQQQLLEREGALSKMNATIDCILGEPTIEEYYALAIEAERLGEAVQETVMQSRAAQQALTPGRVVIVKTPQVPVPSMGVVVRSPAGSNKATVVLALHRGAVPIIPPSSASNSTGSALSTKKLAEEGYFISRKENRGLDDEYSVSTGSSRKGSGTVRVTFPHYGTAAGVGYVVLEVENKNFVSISKAKIKVDPVRLLEDVNVTAYSAAIQQLLLLEQEHKDEDPPTLDPLKDLKLNDLEIVEKYRTRSVLLSKMAQNKCHRCPKLQEHYVTVKNQHLLQERVKQLKFELSDAALQQMPDFQQRIEVLQEVGCIDADLVVQLKGRVACEINSGDELIATECLFDNQLDDLDPAETVALLSALVFQQDASEPLLSPQLAAAKERLYATAVRLGEIQAHHGLPVNAVDFARATLRFGLVEVVYEWAKGTPFADICELTDVPEGSIVRTIVRLDETCREFKNAARIMGTPRCLKRWKRHLRQLKET